MPEITLYNCGAAILFGFLFGFGWASGGWVSGRLLR